MRYLTAVDTSPAVRSTSAADHVGTDLPAALWMATVSAADGGNAAVIEVKSVSDEQTVRPPAFAMGQPLSTISSPDTAAERLEGLPVGGVLELNRRLLMTPEFEDPGNVNNNNGFDTADFPPPPPSAFLYCQLQQQPDEQQHQIRQLNKSCYDVGDRLGNVRYRAEDDATGNIEEDEDTDPDSGTGEDVRSMRDSAMYCDGPNMGPKGDMVYSLLSILGTHNRDDMSRTLLAMSTSFDSCVAMRQAGCLPLLVSLLHPNESTHDHVYQVDDCGFKTYSEEEQATRARAAAALHNIVVANCDSPNGRLEARVLQLLAQIRMYCDQSRLVQQLMLSSDDASEIAPVDMHPGPAVAALMKCSFDEDYRHAICSLGGLQAVAELIQTDNDIVGSTDHVYHVTMRRYACMTLTNLTFGDATNKSLLCSNMSSLRAVVAQLDSPSEDLCQVSASVLRNLSWHSDTASKRALREAGAVRAIVQSALLGVRRESTLKSLLSALWNLSSHGPENKAEICSVPGALEFLVAALGYRGPSKTVAVAENAGGVLRNISSHVAGSEEHRAALRRAGCLPVLLQQLRSPSLTIVSNACGTLWNLSARCPEDQRTLLGLGAVAMLKNLVNSRHRMISMGSAAALKNLLTAASSLGYGTNGSANVSLLLETPMTRSDSAASGPAPGLYMRRQRAFEEELNRRQLSETCDNMESPNTSPTGTLENRSGSHRASSASASFSMPTAGRRLQSPSPVRASVLAGRLANVAAQSSVCRSASSGGIVGSADNFRGEHRVRDVLHRSGRLLRDPLQANGSMTQSLSIATGRQTSTAADLRENRSSYDKISCISSSPSPETSPAVSPISFEQRALKSRSFLKKSCGNKTLDTNSGNSQLDASSSVVSASSFISMHSENIHLGDIGGTSPSDGNDSDTVTASVDISTLMIEAPLEFADKTEEVADSKTFLPNEDSGRQMSFESWLEQTAMATNQRRNSRSGNVFHFNDSHRLSTVLESTGSEVSMTAVDDFLGSPVQVQGRELANCLDIFKATTDCKQSIHSNLPAELPESAGNSRTTSGVVIDMTELFCSKPASTKRTGRKDSCQTVTSFNNSQIVSPLSPVKTPVNNVFDCNQFKCLDEQFAAFDQLSNDQFPTLLSSPTVVTSKQLASTALGDNSADIMMESFPGVMISSQLSDTLMTSSATGDIQVTRCNQSAIPEQPVSKNNGKTVHLGNSNLSVGVECVVSSNLEVERESAGDDASSLLTAKLFSGSSSSELDRMLAENTSTVLMALDSCQMTSGSGTSTSGSSAGEVHLIEDETISLISIEDVDSFIGDDDDDDDYNDAVSNRTYDVRNSDVREDTSVNSSNECSFTSDLDEDSCAFRQRRAPSVCSSSASRDSSAHDGGEHVKPVSVSRPRIVKPGDASASVKPAADDKVNEPRGIRGKRKSLYAATRGGNKPAQQQQNGAKAATTVVSKNTAVLKPGSPVTRKANNSAGAGRKLPGIPNTSSSSVKTVSGQNKTNGPAHKTVLTPPGNVLQQQQQQKRANVVRGRGKTSPASVLEPGPGNRANSAASSRENSVGKRLQQPADRGQNAAQNRLDADSRNGSAKSQLKQPVSNNATKGQTSSTAVDSSATSDAGVDGNRPSVRQPAALNEDSKQKSSAGSSNTGDNGKSANSSGSNASGKTSKQCKPEVKPRTVSLKPASSAMSSGAANATDDKAAIKPVDGGVAATSNTKPGAAVAAKANNAVAAKSSASVASGIRPAVATRTRSLGASVTGSSKAAPTSQPAAQNQQNSNSSSTAAQKSRTSSPCSPVMPRRGSATSGLSGNNASRSRTSSAGSITSLGARSSAAAAAASLAGAAQSVSSATTASGSSGRRGSSAGSGQQTSCYSNVHLTSLPPASKVSRGAKKQPEIPEATKSNEKDGTEVKSRNTFVLMRSSTYDKLTAECDPGTSTASKTSSAAPCEATEDGVTASANDGEKQRPQQPVTRNSTFTKRKAQPSSATSTEEQATAQTKAEKPTLDDVVVLRRQRKSTEIHNAPPERRSGHRQSGAFDPQGNAGVSKDSHRKSRHSALLVKSEQSAVEPAASQSSVQQTCKLANSVPGVLSDVRQNSPDEKLKSTMAATSSTSSPVRKFGFIGGLLRRSNRATTLPRPSRDSSTDDSVTAVKVSGNLPVGDRKKQSATLPAGTASSLKQFITSDGKSKSQKSIPEHSSPKRSSFNWWKRTPSSITATASTGVSSDVVPTASNAGDNAEVVSKPVRRSRIPGAFALGIGSRKTTNQQHPERSPKSPPVQASAVEQSINANSTFANVQSVSPTCRAAIVSPFNYRPPAAATAPTEETTVSAAAVTSECDPAPPLALTKTAMLIERRRMQRAKMAANLSSGALSTMSDDTDKMVLSSTSVSLQSYTEIAVSSPSKEDFGDSLKVEAAPGLIIHGDKGKANFLVTTV